MVGHEVHMGDWAPFALYVAPDPIGCVETADDGRERDHISAVIELRSPTSWSLWARVDDVDYDAFARFRWHWGCTGYAQRAHFGSFPGEEYGPYRVAPLHRMVLGLDVGEPVDCDHINRDKLDNRRCNLRRATKGQNAQNLPYGRRHSRFRGVRRQGNTKWIALGPHYLGTFPTEEEAAVAAFVARREAASFAPEPQELIDLALSMPDFVRASRAAA